MTRFMNMPGFRISQGLQYNEKRLVLEQATLIFETHIFFNLVFLLKQKLTTLYFRYL